MTNPKLNLENLKRLVGELAGEIGEPPYTKAELIIYKLYMELKEAIKKLEAGDCKKEEK